MARVFVSHANDDLTVARRVHEVIIGLGHQVFLAKDIHDGILAGDRWKETLHSALRASDAIVCVVTQAYTRSQWCSYEVGVAREVGTRLIIPLIAEAGVESVLLQDYQSVSLSGDRWVNQLRDVLAKADNRGGYGWPDGRTPFPGLQPFGLGMASVFFGRNEELRALARRLDTLGEGAALLVVGPSGSGKSSLVTAGLRRELGAEDRWLLTDPFLPGRDPVRKLAWSLAEAKLRLRQERETDQIEPIRHRLRREIQDRLESNDYALVELAEELLSSAPSSTPDRKLLLIIDQGEELITRSEQANRRRFADLLRPAIDGQVRIVIALRSEFHSQLAALPELAGIATTQFPLAPLSRGKLPVVIREPARVAGLRIDDDLVARMVAETDGGEALPLLAFTLNELARDVPRGGTLSPDRYERLGGVRGALTVIADQVLDEAVAVSGLSREEILSGLTELANIDTAGRRTRRRIDLDDQVSPEMKTALEVFVRRGLLSPPADSLGGTGLGVVHEALLTAWKPLDAAIQERHAALTMQSLVERAAAARNSGEGSLWDADRTTTACTTLWGSMDRYRRGEKPVVNLNEAARGFLADCWREINRSRRRRRLRVFGSIAVLVVLLGVAVILNSRAQHARHAAELAQHQAVAQALLTEADNVRSTDPTLAVQLAIAAEAIRPHQDSRASLLRTLSAGTPPTLFSPGAPVTAIAFSPSGKLLATGEADATVSLWDVSTGQPRLLGGPLTGHSSVVAAVAFSRDGRTLTATAADGAVLAWDVTAPAQPHALSAPPGGQGGQNPIQARSADGRLEADLTNGTIELWNVADPSHRRRLAVLAAGPGHTRALAFSPDSQLLAAVGSNPAVWVWDVSGAAPEAVGQPLTGHTRSLLSLAFSPGGDRFASGGNDGTVRLWNRAAVNAFRDGSIVTYACDTAGGLDRSAWAYYVRGLRYRNTCPHTLTDN
jgi:hypothetical protein